LSDLLDPTTLRPGISEEFRKQVQSGRHPSLLTPLLREFSGIRTGALDNIGDGDVENTVKRVQTYWGFAVAVHDALVQYSQSYPAAALELKGQVFAERLIHDSFSSSSFFEGLWSLAGSLTPKQLAAWLAEHLRAHFSGPDRGGAVEIIEERDRYCLIFDACGSGLAMRRRLRSAGQPVETLPCATPATWNRAGEVPTYCSHCAFNELESLRRFGYPIFVTEFKADASKPCGWTI